MPKSTSSETTEHNKRRRKRVREDEEGEENENQRAKRGRLKALPQSVWSTSQQPPPTGVEKNRGRRDDNIVDLAPQQLQSQMQIVVHRGKSSKEVELPPTSTLEMELGNIGLVVGRKMRFLEEELKVVRGELKRASLELGEMKEEVRRVWVVDHTKQRADKTGSSKLVVILTRRRRRRFGP